MKFLHTMVRVKNLEESIDFFTNKLGLVETRRKDFENGRFTLLYLATKPGEPEVELTYNWDQSEDYDLGNGYGHIALGFDDIYETCEKIRSAG